MLKRLWREDEGVLTFEWIMLLTLLVIGVIGGVAGIRDAIIHECHGVVGAMVSLDQSYYIAPPLTVSVSSPSATDGACGTSGANGSGYADTVGNYSEGRSQLPVYTAVPTGTPCPITAVPGGTVS